MSFLIQWVLSARFQKGSVCRETPTYSLGGEYSTGPSSLLEFKALQLQYFNIKTSKQEGWTDASRVKSSQRTGVQFPAFTQWLTIKCILVPRDPMLSSGLYRYQAPTQYTEIYAHKIKNNFKKKGRKRRWDLVWWHKPFT